MKLMANSKEDVLRLATHIRETPQDDRCQLAADVLYLNLMNVDNDYVSDVIRLFRKHNQEESIKMFVSFSNKFDENFVDDFIEATAKHIVGGFDMEDEDSAGGWSQREIDLLIAKRGW